MYSITTSSTVFSSSYVTSTTYVYPNLFSFFSLTHKRTLFSTSMQRLCKPYQVFKKTTSRLIADCNRFYEYDTPFIDTTSQAQGHQMLRRSFPPFRITVIILITLRFLLFFFSCREKESKLKADSEYQSFIQLHGVSTKPAPARCCVIGLSVPILTVQLE